jgi:hypothetical protein
MALSRVAYVGNGSTKDFNVPFPYLDKAHIKVTLDNVLTGAWTWLNNTTIRITTPPAPGVDIVIRRDTSSSTRLVTYVAPSSLNESDLNADGIQNFYLAQEAVDTANNIAGTAKNISVVPAGGITSINVQAALEELDTKKSPTTHTHPDVTTSTRGFMTAADKVKLDGVQAGAQVNAVTTVAGKTGAVTLAKTDVGLGNVDNTSDAAKPVSSATATALAGKAAIDHTHANASNLEDGFLSKADKIKLDGITAGAQPNTVTSVAGRVGDVVVNKGDVGLGNVDNTSDAAKPISTATATALVGKSDTSHTHADATTSAPGFMSKTDKIKLDALSPITQLGDIPNVNVTSPTTNQVLTWDGTKWKNAGLSGDVPTNLGNLADVNASGLSANFGLIYSGTQWVARVLVKGDVGLGNVDNTSDANKPISTATQTALDGKAALNHSHADATGSTAGFLSATDKTKLDGIAAGAQVNTITTVQGRVGAVTISKADVGLSNVDNTADAVKPISGPVQGALDYKSNIDHTHVMVSYGNHGFMYASDKQKLDGIQPGAQVNSVVSVKGRTGAVNITSADVVAGFGVVGSWILAESNIACNAGQTVNGANLKYSKMRNGGTLSSGGTLNGTWMLMGLGVSGAGDMGLWHRIS